MSERAALAIMRIYDADFYLDRDNREFRQVDDEKNRISFADVNEQGEHDLIYDLRTKNAFQGTLEQMLDRQDLVLIKLPKVIRADIDRLMDRPRKLSIDEPKHDDGQIPPLRRRKKGKGI